jgi:hypothetical protein
MPNRKRGEELAALGGQDCTCPGRAQTLLEAISLPAEVYCLNIVLIST